MRIERKKQGVPPVPSASSNGFSLVELTVSIVITGALALIAIPLLLGAQLRAEDTAREAVAANAATEAAARLALEPSRAIIASDLERFRNVDQYTISVADGDDIRSFCVSVEEAARATKRSGPGCTTTSG